MAIKFIDRQSQLDTFNVKLFSSSIETNDSIFDGEDVPRGTYARNWKLESELHQTVLLSESLQSTRNFLGQQHNIVRDELRRKTWACFIENGDTLAIAEISSTGEINKEVLLNEGAWRSHIALEKYTGKIIVVAILKEDGRNQLWFDGKIINTEAEEPDFPFFEFNSVSIGHVPSREADYGLLTYKCRSSGKLFTRPFTNGELGEEKAFECPSTLGGAGIAISGNDVLLRIDELKGEDVVPIIYRSNNKGLDFGEPEEIESPYDDEFKFMPASAPPARDFSGAFHVPIAMTNKAESVALDLVVDVALVEAIRKPGEFRMVDRVASDAFPKTVCAAVVTDAIRFGDGKTDGIGVITSLQTTGKVYTSNSQSGGISYPESGYINHEMPSIAAYDTTECHTTGERPNTVSMDYIYIEASSDGIPLSQELHYETWDMPLPIPTIKAEADRGMVKITILQNANFVNGKTVFEFDDPMVAITNVEINGTREAILSTDAEDLRGKVVTFEARTILYHHKASAVIE